MARTKLHQKAAIAFVALGMGTAPVFTQAAIAQETSVNDLLNQIDAYSTEGTMSQGVGASQFSDVSPGDWAFQALDDLVRRYDCLKGYPNGTFRGNRALSRYEFAAGLNACLQQIERLIAETTADFATKEDLETLRRLMQEFEAELATLGTRVDNLESRVAFLEDNQFSTTTKLQGEVIFGLTDIFQDSSPQNIAAGVLNGLPNVQSTDNDDTNTVFGYRARLTFNTSFTGQDQLVTRLATGNLNTFNSNAYSIPGIPDPTPITSGEPTQTFNNSDDNGVVVDWLAYYFPFRDSQAYVAARGGVWSDFVPTVNPYFEDFDGGNGALSTFASSNPIYRIGGGAGAGFSFGFSPIESILGPSTITVGYLAGQASDAADGLFNGDYAILGQVNFNLNDDIALGVTYVNGYHPSGTAVFDAGGVGTRGVVGSGFANAAALTKVTNSYGGEFAWRLNDSIALSGFATYTDMIGIGTGNGEVWTYGLGLAFPDLGKEGNLLGLFAGAQPYLGNFDALGSSVRKDGTPYHVEAFYKYQVNDNISITPGVIWLTSPNQVDDGALIGTIRTTFTF
ncbi:iron uptake porin [Spirulina major]|uniref:iron uptake porin n=1 Tax=Spirulina major TaxID=270636 RepID=UPI00093258EF|nr:iron uptake porin [Spirulina major]